MNGVEVGAGSLIDYLYVDAGHQNPFRRVRPARFAEGRIDTEKYVDLVREAVESLIGVLDHRDGVKSPLIEKMAAQSESGPWDHIF